MKGRKGVVGALKRLAEENSLGRLPTRKSGNVDDAVRLASELIETLPPPHVLASALANEYARMLTVYGDCKAVQRLKHSYTQIERILEQCHALTISYDVKAVDHAEAIMERVMLAQRNPRHELCRGDWLDANNLGATISAAYPSGMCLELTLRKAHSEIDFGEEAKPEGHWILEGYACRAGVVQDEWPSVNLYLGPSLPENIERIIASCLNKLTDACGASVLRLVSSAADVAAE